MRRNYQGTEVSERDYQALKEIEEQLGQPIPKINEFCSTFGFTTTGINITGVVIIYQVLGSLPEAIGQLTNLQELNLEYNILKSLPATLG
ncbi:MAG: hypothetical protein ACW964_08540 [Candidatus Hodarchaeales archaeon]|jgi:Leucine-rich repeat (LRR) protein